MSTRRGKTVRRGSWAAAVVAVAIASLSTSAAADVAPSWRAVRETAMAASEYVALGDSFSSGEGNAPFVEGTDEAGTNECHRSSSSFPDLVGSGLGFATKNVACSGALTFNVTSEGRWNEPAQLNHLSATVTFATLTIGGNDAGFAKVISACIIGVRACDSEQRDREVRARIVDLRPALKSTYEAVRESLSESGELLVVGYPVLFSEERGCGPYSSLSRSERIWLNEMTDLLDRVMERAATAASVEYLSVLNTFRGHELCHGASGTRDTWVNKPTLINKVRSVHPNLAGHAAIATRVIARAKALFSGIELDLVTPKRLGPMVYGESTFTEALALLGSPTQVDDLYPCQGGFEARWRSGVTYSFDAGEVVYSGSAFRREVNSQAGLWFPQTDKRLRVGDSEAKLKVLYPAADIIEWPSGKQEYVLEVADGIYGMRAVVAASSGRVVTLGSYIAC